VSHSNLKYGVPFIEESLVNNSMNVKHPVLVDFGCWSGRHLKLLQNIAEGVSGKTSDNSVIGVDEEFAEERLKEARKLNKAAHLMNTGISTTGLPSSSIDGAISWRVLHNLIQPGEWTKAITEIKRVLKHGAPLVVSVRATQGWMADDTPVPLLYKTFTPSTDRDDLYFSEATCYSMFRFYGFDIPYKAVLFEEGETVNGTKITNEYWMIYLICNKEVYLSSERPTLLKPPTKSYRNK
jgi:SAM-dependent methyltransferase